MKKENIKREMKINNDDMEGSKFRVKSNIGRKTKEFFKEKIEKEGNQKSKVIKSNKLVLLT